MTDTTSTGIKTKIVIFLLTSLALMSIKFPFPNGEVLGATSEDLKNTDYSKNVTSITTTTAFDQKEIQEYATIPFKTIYEDDDEMEYGKEEIIKEYDKTKR